jgi:hypothetical protein
VRLRITLVLLAVLTATMCVARRDTRSWPVIAWPVYDDVHPEAPPPELVRLEVRVELDDGEVVALRDRDLIEFSRVAIAERALEGAQDSVEDRAFLASLVRAATGEVPRRYELWGLTLRVDGAHVPPLDLDRSEQERLLARFDRDGRTLPG